MFTYINVYFFFTGLEMSKYQSIWTHFYSTGELLSFDDTEVTEQTPKKRGRPRKQVVSPQSPSTSKACSPAPAKKNPIKPHEKAKKSSEYMVTYYTVYS